MPTLYATNRTAGDGVQEQFEISFSGGYIDRDHVKAYIEDDTTLARTAIAITEGMWVGPYTIDLGQSAPVGSTMVIYRDTPKDGPMVDFTNGSIITEANLDLIAKQGVFGVAEVSDAAGQSSSLIALDAMAQAQAAAVSAAASAAIALGAAGTAAAGAVYTFDGTGAQVLFTIPLPTLDPNVTVYINGVYQAKGTYAHASGALSSTITFSTAPLAGTGNIEVVVTVGVDQAVIDGVTADAAAAAASASAASGSAAAAAGSAIAADASADAAAASAIAAEASSRLDVGTTTTGAPGSSVVVAISGAPGTQLLSLTIPRGDVGATGATGATGPAGADGAIAAIGVTAPITSTGGASPTLGIVAATTSVPGSMSAADKTKLDAITGTNTGDQDLSSYATKTGAETLTNKRVTSRRGSITSHATPTFNTDSYDVLSITAQTEAITSMTTNLTGTPVHGDPLIVEITGTATRAITWGSKFEASTVALPTTTVTTAMLSVAFLYNGATSKWRCVGVV